MTKDDEAAFAAAFDEPVSDMQDDPVTETEENPTTADEEVKAGEETPEPSKPVESETAAQEEPTEQAEKPFTREEFKGYLDEREKRQKAEAEAERFRRELETLRQSQTQKPEQEAPDYLDDPKAWQQHQEQQYQAALLQQRIQQSEFFARQQYGDDTINQVDQWLRTDGQQHINQLRSHPSPFHAAVEVYRKEQAAKQLAEYDYDLDKLIAARTAPPQQEAATPETPAAEKPKLPPKVSPGGVQQEAPRQSESSIYRAVFGA